MNQAIHRIDWARTISQKMRLGTPNLLLFRCVAWRVESGVH